MLVRRELLSRYKALSWNVQDIATFKSRSFNARHLNLLSAEQNEPVCCSKFSIILGHFTVYLVYIFRYGAIELPIPVGSPGNRVLESLCGDI
jgi:hypothetical protein